MRKWALFLGLSVLALAVVAIASKVIPTWRVTAAAARLVELLQQDASRDWWIVCVDLHRQRAAGRLPEKWKWQVTESLCVRMMAMRSIRGQDDLDELGVLFDQVDYFSQRDWQHCATSTREKARLGFEAALRAYWEYVAKAGMEMTSNMFGLGSCLETVAATDFSNDIFADNFERAVKEKVLSVQEMIYVLVGAVAENEGLRRRLQPLAREIPDAVFSRAQTNRQLKLESHLFIELCRTLAKVWPDAYKTD